MHLRNIGKVFLAIGFCVFAAFFGRFVVNAYITEPAAVQIRLTGVDLRTEIEDSSEESPFSLNSPDDLRRFPTDLGFIANPFVSAEPEEIEPLGQTPEPELTPEEELILGGEATIEGRVVGPDGPVEGAVVRLERETDSGIGTLDIVTDEEGIYEVKGLLGGRYRARAFVPAEFASANIETFFLEDISAESLTIDFLEIAKPKPLELNLRVREHSENIVAEFITGGNIFRGSTGQFGVSVSQQVVDEDGVIVLAPQSGFNVTLSGVPDYANLTNVSQTNARGLAVFTARCDAVTRGGHTGTIRVAKQVRELIPADPVPATATTTTSQSATRSSPDTTATSAQPTTTRPRFRTVTLTDTVRVNFPRCVTPPPPPEPEPSTEEETPTNQNAATANIGANNAG